MCFSVFFYVVGKNVRGEPSKLGKYAFQSMTSFPFDAFLTVRFCFFSASTVLPLDFRLLMHR